MPAVIRTSADWDSKKVKKKKKKHQQLKKNGNNQSTISNGTMKTSGENKGIDGGCVVIQDVWCAPGIGFSTDAVVDGSVDCVVSAPRRNVSGRGKIDGEKINNNHREVRILYIYIYNLILLYAFSLYNLNCHLRISFVVDWF